MTNRRIMWLLIGQGLIANAYVSAGEAPETVVTMLALAGILRFLRFVLKPFA